MNVVKLHFGSQLKSANTQISCNIGKSNKNFARFSDFPMLQLGHMFLQYVTIKSYRKVLQILQN